MFDPYAPIYFNYVVQSFVLALLVFMGGMMIAGIVSGVYYAFHKDRGIKYAIAQVFRRMLILYMLLSVVTMLGVSLTYYYNPALHLKQFKVLLF